MTAPADTWQVGRHTEPAASSPAAGSAELGDGDLFPPLRREADRLLTPAVLVAAVLVAGVLVLSVVVGMVVLTLRGLDPDPMLKLTAQAGGGLAAVLNLWVSVAGRASTAKTERNTGVLARQVAALEAARRTETAPDRPPGGFACQD